MPGKDGTGPRSSGGGRYGGQIRRGTGGGRRGVPAGAGPEGFCICPNCDTKMQHQAGQPCYNIKCPQCGTAMVRA